jgi:hypothetical protein
MGIPLLIFRTFYENNLQEWIIRVETIVRIKNMMGAGRDPVREFFGLIHNQQTGLATIIPVKQTGSE